MIGKTYHVGAPLFIMFQFARNEHQPVRVYPNALVRAGREWMREQMPKQWAAFCEAILNKDTNVRDVGLRERVEQNVLAVAVR